MIRGSEVSVFAAQNALAEGLGIDALRDAVEDGRVERGATLRLGGQGGESPARHGLAADPGVVGDLQGEARK